MKTLRLRFVTRYPADHFLQGGVREGRSRLVAQALQHPFHRENHRAHRGNLIHQISLTKYWYSNSVLYLLEYSVLFAKTARR